MSKDFVKVKVHVGTNIRTSNHTIKMQKGCMFQNKGGQYIVDNNGELKFRKDENSPWENVDQINMTKYQWSVFQNLTDNDGNEKTYSKEDIELAWQKYKTGEFCDDLSNSLPNGYRIERNDAEQAQKPKRADDNAAEKWVEAYVGFHGKDGQGELDVEHSARLRFQISEIEALKAASSEPDITQEYSESYTPELGKADGPKDSTRTLAMLREHAINSAKEALKNMGCTNLDIQRPLPHIVDGHIEAACILQTPPPLKKGGLFGKDEQPRPLEGKVIILNSGHGGFQNDKGYFDSGTISVRKEGNNTYPIEEWSTAMNYTDTLSKELIQKGATVIIVQGAVQNGGMCSQEYLENLIGGQKGPKEVRDLINKTNHSNMLFLSVHFDNVPANRVNSSVIGAIGDEADAKFASNIQNALAAKYKDSDCDLTPKIGQRDLYVLRAMGSDIPAVLLEVGNINNAQVQEFSEGAQKTKNIKEYTQIIASAIEQTMTGAPVQKDEPKDTVPPPAQKPDTAKTKPAPADTTSGSRQNYINEQKHDKHTVSAGDTYSKLSRQYNVTLNYIIALNGGNTNLSIGQEVIIPSTRSAKNIKNIDDIAKALGVSREFISKLKFVEDGYKDGKPYAENEFHNSPYIDSEGHKTVGIGHRVNNDYDKTLTDNEVVTLLANDLLKMEENIWAVIGKETYENLPQPVKEALLDMTFNKGTKILTESGNLIQNLKDGKYEDAINCMTYNKSEKGNEMSGLSKRRLLDISFAIKIYNGRVPKSIKNTIQQVYNEGIKLLEKECKQKGYIFGNMLAGYNKDVLAYFDGIDIDLKTQ